MPIGEEFFDSQTQPTPDLASCLGNHTRWDTNLCAKHRKKVVAIDDTLSSSQERFRISFGGFIKRFNAKLRLDSEEHGIGTEIHLEDDLGMNPGDSDLTLFGGARLGKRTRLRFGYYRWTRHSNHVIEEEIEWGDEIIEIGVRVDFDDTTQVLQASYSYSVYLTEGWDVRFSGGLSVFEFDANLEVQGNADPLTGYAEISTVHKSTLLAPVPAIGFLARYTIKPKLQAVAQGVFFAYQADTWGGSMFDVGILIDWFPWRNVGFGAGHNWVRLNYDYRKMGDLKVDYNYSGFLVYVTATF